MFSIAEIGIKYLKYLATSANGKGHGVHSPFVFNFIQSVLNDHTIYPEYQQIESLRKELLADKTLLTLQDFGAGSSVIASNTRKVGDIARSSLKPRKYSQLLFRLVRYYQPKTIFELGTSLGITTSYLGAGNPDAHVVTFEGASEVAEVAKTTLRKNKVTNVQLVQGNFDDTLQPALREVSEIDFAFIDGNHRHEPTVRYFRHLLQASGENSIFVFDDIHWSAEMEAAWEEIKRDPAVSLSVDLFFIGIVFFRKENKVKQQFSIRH